MTRTVRKGEGAGGRTWKRQTKEDSTKHWLGEGGVGQETLFLELTVEQYLIDQELCSVAVQIARTGASGPEPPVSLFIPPTSSVSWLIGYLSRLFDTYVWQIDSTETLVLDATSHFAVEIISGELPPDLPPLHLLLHAKADWANEREFSLSVRELCQYLHRDGVALFVIHGEDSGEEARIRWASGELSLLGDLLQSLSQYRQLVVPEVTKIFLEPTAIDDRERLRAFLHRHRSYFGRNARDFLLARMSDPDFREVSVAHNNQTNWVGILQFDSTNESQR